MRILEMKSGVRVHTVSRSDVHGETVIGINRYIDGDNLGALLAGIGACIDTLEAIAKKKKANEE